MARNKQGIFKDGKTWRVSTSINLNGRRHRISKRGFKTQNEAYIYKEVKVNKILNENYVTGYVSVKLALEMFFEYKALSLKEGNIYHYRKRLEKHTEQFKAQSIKIVATYNYLLDYKDYVIKLNVTTKYKNRLIRIYQEFLVYTFNRGLIDNEALKNINLILTPIINEDKQKIQKVWSKAQYQAFLDAMPKKSLELVLFTLWGQLGARISEIRALQVKHFNIYDNTISIVQQANSKLGVGKTVITTPKTVKSIRTIHISESLAKLLNDYISELKLDKNDFLFTSNRNYIISENTIRRLINKYSEIAGLPKMNPHGIRHSNTTWLLTGILNLDEIGTVSERLGHTSKKTTLDIYFHINKSDSKDLVKLVDFN